MPEQPITNVPATRRPQRPITGARLGHRRLIAAWMLRGGASYREITQATGLSSRTISAIKHQNILNPKLIEAIDQTYNDRVKLRGHEALTQLEDVKNLKNPSRASVLWKIVKEARELVDRKSVESDGLTVADMLAAIGARRATVISRVTVAQGPVASDQATCGLACKNCLVGVPPR